MEESKKNLNHTKIIKAILGIIAGTIIIIVANNSFNSSYKPKEPETAEISVKTESDAKYGGDAYTGIQQASAQTATNTYYIYELVQNTNNGIGIVSRQIMDFSNMFFTTLGILVILYNAGKLFE